MFANYIKIAWKVLLRNPFYTFITLFGISLTLTVIMVLTSFIDHMIGSNYPEVNRSRSLYISFLARRDSVNTGMMRGPMTFQFLSDHVKTLKSAEKVSIFSFFSSSNAYAGSKKINLQIKYTDSEFWEIMKFDFLEGKPYSDAEIRGSQHVAVITHTLKQQYFQDKDEAAIGKTIEIEGIGYRVIGVVKGSPVTRIYTAADVYFPYTAPKSGYDQKGLNGRFVAVAMSADKQSLKAMNDEFQARISQIPPDVDGRKFTSLEVPSQTFTDIFLSTVSQMGPNGKTIFYAAVAFILLMILGLPAVNLVNVNVSRIFDRASEIAVRKAFGAPVNTLLWQFLVENIFITLIGSGIALLLTFGIISWVNASDWIAHLDLTVNLNVFLISMLVTLFFGLLSGVLPAYRMSRLKVTDALKA